MRIEQGFPTILNLDTIPSYTVMNVDSRFQSAHIRSAMGKAIQNKKAKERRKLRKEKVEKKRELETIPPILPQPEPRRRSGELNIEFIQYV